jgi:segregation and condensation protein B
MELKLILEAILFSAQKPLTPSALRDLLVRAAEGAEEPGPKACKKVKVEEIDAALEELARDQEAARRSYQLACVAGAWQFVIRPEYAPWLKALVGERARPGRLSLAALETLAIIAYRQPLIRAEIEQIRGVSVDGVMQTLLERGLIESVGRADVIGRPQQYGTTVQFLEYFGLRGLEDLPAADELRRIPLQRPASLVTADPGLATRPPEQLTLEEVDRPPEDRGASSAALSPEPVADSATVPTSSPPSDSPPPPAPR